MIPGAFGPEITKIPLMDEVLRRHRYQFDATSREIADPARAGRYPVDRRPSLCLKERFAGPFNLPNDLRVRTIEAK